MEEISKRDLKNILEYEYSEDIVKAVGKWNDYFGAWEYIVIYYDDGTTKKIRFDW